MGKFIVMKTVNGKKKRASKHTFWGYPNAIRYAKSNSTGNNRLWVEEVKV